MTDPYVCIYGTIYHQYTPFMLAFFYHTWIRHGNDFDRCHTSTGIDFGSSNKVVNIENSGRIVGQSWDNGNNTMETTMDISWKFDENSMDVTRGNSVVSWMAILGKFFSP